MRWILFALASALCSAMATVGQKSISTKAHPLLLSLAMRIWALPVIVVWFILIPQHSRIIPGFWLYLTICCALTVLGSYLSFLALRLADLSLILPLSNLTPALTLLSAWKINNERPKMKGIVGVLLIGIGSFQIARNSTTGTGKRQAKRAIVAMIVVAFLYSITSSFDKLGVANSSPLLWTLGLNVGMTLLILPLLSLLTKQERLTKIWRVSLPTGVLNALSMLLQMFAFQAGGRVAYVLAIEQLDILIALLIGWQLLREKQRLPRFINALLMAVGALIIAITL